MYKYLIFLFILIFIFIISSHYIDYNRINPILNIQQSEQPTPEVIDLMFDKRQPTIFRYELELWDGFDLLIGQTYENIISVIKNNKILEYNCQKIYLKPFSLPLTKKWNIKCHKTNKNWDDLSLLPINECNYRHLIACFSGMATICLISPTHTNYIKNTKNLNFKLELINNPNKYEYITIPLRPSHMIYIPYGWNYYIYSGLQDKYCVLLDMNCITYFN